MGSDTLLTMAPARPSSAFLQTVAFGFGGGFAFWLAGLPAPWLSGSMLGVVLMLVLGRRPELANPLRDAGILLAGIVMGSAITPEMIGAIGHYPVSLAILALTMAAITLTGRWVLFRWFGWGHGEATFASLPGAMSSVLALASATGADMAKVSAVQAFRMFVLVALLPSLVALMHGATRAAPPPSIASPAGFALVGLIALAVSYLLERMNVLAPFLLGGMIASGVTHASGWVPGGPAPGIADLSMFLIGIFAGSRFGDVSAAALKAMIAPALILFLLSSALAVLGAFATVWLVGMPVAEALVAFAPGGLEAMVVLGLALGLDPLYVSSHHIARFVLVAALLPFVARWLIGKGS